METNLPNPMTARVYVNLPEGTMKYQFFLVKSLLSPWVFAEFPMPGLAFRGRHRALLGAVFGFGNAAAAPTLRASAVSAPGEAPRRYHGGPPGGKGKISWLIGYKGDPIIFFGESMVIYIIYIYPLFQIQSTRFSWLYPLFHGYRWGV